MPLADDSKLFNLHDTRAPAPSHPCPALSMLKFDSFKNQSTTCCKVFCQYNLCREDQSVAFVL